MAINFDASTAGYEADFDGTITVNHTPSGTPRCAVALIFSSANGVGHAGGTCTYGGTSMTAVEREDNSTGSFTMGGSIFFLDDVSSGAQNCVWTAGGGGGRDHMVVITFTADGACEVVASVAGINTDSTSTHTYTLALGGTTSYVLAGGITTEGDVANIAPLSGWGTDVASEQDHGSATSFVYSLNTQSSGNVTCGVDLTGTTEEIGIALGLAESGGGGGAATPGIEVVRTIPGVAH